MTLRFSPEHTRDGPADDGRDPEHPHEPANDDHSMLAEDPLTGLPWTETLLPLITNWAGASAVHAVCLHFVGLGILAGLPALQSSHSLLRDAAERLAPAMTDDDRLTRFSGNKLLVFSRRPEGAVRDLLVAVADRLEDFGMEVEGRRLPEVRIGMAALTGGSRGAAAVDAVNRLMNEAVTTTVPLSEVVTPRRERGDGAEPAVPEPSPAASPAAASGRPALVPHAEPASGSAAPHPAAPPVAATRHPALEPRAEPADASGVAADASGVMADVPGVAADVASETLVEETSDTVAGPAPKTPALAPPAMAETPTPEAPVEAIPDTAAGLAPEAPVEAIPDTAAGLAPEAPAPAEEETSVRHAPPADADNLLTETPVETLPHLVATSAPEAAAPAEEETFVHRAPPAVTGEVPPTGMSRLSETSAGHEPADADRSSERGEEMPMITRGQFERTPIRQPAASPGPGPVMPAGGTGHRLILKSVNVVITGLVATAITDLDFEGRLVRGKAIGRNTEGHQVDLVAEALTRAVTDLLPPGHGVVFKQAVPASTDAGDVVVTVVEFLTPERTDYLFGVAPITAEPVEGVARSVLNAVEHSTAPLLAAVG